MYENFTLIIRKRKALNMIQPENLNRLYYHILNFSNILDKGNETNDMEIVWSATTNIRTIRYLVEKLTRQNIVYVSSSYEDKILNDMSKCLNHLNKKNKSVEEIEYNEHIDYRIEIRKKNINYVTN